MTSLRTKRLAAVAFVLVGVFQLIWCIRESAEAITATLPALLKPGLEWFSAVWLALAVMAIAVGAAFFYFSITKRQE
jgi:hypothetical protein